MYVFSNKVYIYMWHAVLLYCIYITFKCTCTYGLYIDCTSENKLTTSTVLIYMYSQLFWYYSYCLYLWKKNYAFNHYVHVYLNVNDQKCCFHQFLWKSIYFTCPKQRVFVKKCSFCLLCDNFDISRKCPMNKCPENYFIVLLMHINISSYLQGYLSLISI